MDQDEITIHPTRRIERPFVIEQPDRPFSVVRLGMFYVCQCPEEWLRGENALDMMLQLKGLSADSGFTVIGEHYDLYGRTRIEMLTNGWTINLTFAQSGASFDAWHIPRTMDINVHWCHEEGDTSTRSPNHDIEERFFALVEKLFKPRLAIYNPRAYRILSLTEAELAQLLLEAT